MQRQERWCLFFLIVRLSQKNATCFQNQCYRFNCICILLIFSSAYISQDDIHPCINIWSSVAFIYFHIYFILVVNHVYSPWICVYVGWLSFLIKMFCDSNGNEFLLLVNIVCIVLSKYYTLAQLNGTCTLVQYFQFVLHCTSLHWISY